jgi:hypothetical protein
MLATTWVTTAICAVEVVTDDTVTLVIVNDGDAVGVAALPPPPPPPDAEGRVGDEATVFDTVTGILAEVTTLPAASDARAAKRWTPFARDFVSREKL